MDNQVIYTFSNTIQSSSLLSKTHLVSLFWHLVEQSEYFMYEKLIQWQKRVNYNGNGLYILNSMNLYHLIVSYFSHCAFSQILDKWVLKK